MSYTELADRLSAFIIDDEFLNAVDEVIAILRSLDAQRPTVDEVMAQAQVFASAWALVGSRFVSGSGLEEAEQEKKDLCALVEALAAPVAAQPTEQEQSQFFCGVDFADGVLAVSVMRRRPDDVAELIHSEQIEVAAQPQQAKPEPLSSAEILDLAEPFGAFEFGDAQGDKRLAFARAAITAFCQKNGIKE